MVDNFALLDAYIRHNKTFTENDFLFLQIIKRRKDNPDAKFSQETIKNMHITSADDMMERKDVIIDWCEKHNARAYLRLNLRDKQKIALRTLALVAENIANGNPNIKNCYESAVGQYHHDPKKTWVVDVDYDEYDYDGRIVLCKTVIDLVRETGRSSDEIITVPTKNGFHLITPPFNTKKFSEVQTVVSLQKHADNPTILYIP